MQAVDHLDPTTAVGRWKRFKRVLGSPHGALPTGLRLTIWNDLMSCAVAADAPEVQAMAGVAERCLQRLTLAGAESVQRDGEVVHASERHSLILQSHDGRP